MGPIRRKLHWLNDVAAYERESPTVQEFARQVTDPHASAGEKVCTLVAEVRRRFLTESTDLVFREMLWTPSLLLSREPEYPSIDTAEFCVLVASLAGAAGVDTQVVGVRYGSHWTWWVACKLEGRWVLVDPSCLPHMREPDQIMWGGDHFRDFVDPEWV